MSSNLSSSFPQFKFEMAKGRAHSIYEFNEFRLDEGKLMLYSGGREIHLPPKAVETLSVLVRSGGEIVSKDELITTVWTDSIVEESNLSQYLYLLRKTLGKQPDGTPYIETLRRRGYRFNGDARPIETTISADRGLNGHIRTAEDEDKTMAVAPNPLPAFERRGNVIALNDWVESDRSRADRRQAVVPEPSSSASTTSRTWMLAGVLLILAAIGGGGGYFLYSLNSAVIEQPSEITISRLTNGIAPQGATISPDGKYFVYYESGSEYRMWLQQTGYSAAVEIIPASEKPLCCTAFSPDGQFVYYLAGDSVDNMKSLYRVPKLGGPSAKIRPNISSAVSFSPDGNEMVYSRFDRQKNETQYVVGASDGSGDERVVFTSPGSYSTAPAWSPDASSIVFARSASGEDGNYVLTNLDVSNGSVRSLSEEAWDMCHRIMWKADGRGFFLIGTKAGDRLTARRDQVYFVSYPDGVSRRITTDPTSRQQPDSLGVTTDGSVLTVPYNRSSQIWVMDASGNSLSARQISSGISDGRAGMAPMSDGRIVYVAWSGDSTNLFAMNADGSNPKALLADGIMPDEPRSSRGTPYMVFSIYNWPYSHLFRANANGGEVTQLTFGESREIDSSISNDGNWVAYGSLAVPVTTADISLWKVSINGGEPIRLKQNNCLMPHFSPDDKLLSCVEDQKRIHILSAVDGTLIRTIPVTPLAWLNSGARWTPDGKSVAYIVTEKGVSNIWTHPIDGGEPKPLTDFNLASIYNFAFSADGSRLFVARGQQVRDAMLIQNIK